MGKLDGVNRREFLGASGLALVARGPLLAGADRAGGKVPPLLRNNSQYVALRGETASTFGIEGGLLAGAGDSEQLRPLARSEQPLRVTYYEGVKPADSFSSGYHSAEMPDPGTLRASCDWSDGRGSGWRIQTTIRICPAGFLMETQWELASGFAKGVALQHVVSPLISPQDAWSFIPGLLYHGNRADFVKDMAYCPYLTLEEMRKLECDKKEVRVIDSIPRIDKGTLRHQQGRNSLLAANRPYLSAPHSEGKD